MTRRNLFQLIATAFITPKITPEIDSFHRVYEFGKASWATEPASIRITYKDVVRTFNEAMNSEGTLSSMILVDQDAKEFYEKLFLDKHSVPS